MNWFNYLVPIVASPTNGHHVPSHELFKRLCETENKEVYTCMFDLEERDTFNSYKGKARSVFGRIWFDFDSDIDKGLTAYKDLKAFISWLNIPIDELAIYFSGKKGFALGVPAKYFPFPEISDNLGKLIGTWIHKILPQYPTLDPGIYNMNRKFRGPNSCHPGTGLYKTRIYSLDMPLDEIKQLATRATPPSPLQIDYEEGKALPHIKESIGKVVDRFYSSTDKPIGDDPYQQYTDFKDKKCIKRLLEDRCDPGGRHKTALVMISDLYHTGHHVEDTVKTMKKWATLNGLMKEDRWEQVERQIDLVYSRAVEYTFGCNIPEKASKCTARCSLRRHLSKEARPTVMDAPKTELMEEKGLKEQMVVDQLIADLGAGLVKQDRSLFKYTGTHWVELETRETDAIKRKIMEICLSQASSRDVDSAYRTFLVNVPHVPTGTDFFIPKKNMANFTNGTLHFDRANDHSYKIEWKKHNPHDYLTWVLPFDYLEGNSERNKEFDAMLERIWGQDSDKEDKIRLLAQIYGAALIPLFPKVVLVKGPPQTGKSSLLKMMMKLVADQNICNVAPSDFDGFNMETMVGKLVNVDLDIPLNAPLNDALVKKITDQVPQRVRRKGIKDVRATMPALHAFGCNALPKTFEGTTAYDRRVVVLETWKKQGVGEYDLQYENTTWNLCPQGVINFAVSGLMDLARSKGHYHVPESSRRQVTEMQENHDPVAQFLREIKEGEILDKDNQSKPIDASRISRKFLWETFTTWFQFCHPGARCLGKKQFLDSLRRKGCSELRDNAGRYFDLGFGNKVLGPEY